MKGDAYDKYLKQAISGAMPALVKMREEGMIKAWGMGVNTLPPILAALEASDPDVLLAACQYTLLDHEASLEKLFPACEKSGASVVVGSPLNAGYLAGTKNYNYLGKVPKDAPEKRAKMAEIALMHGTDLRTVALQFCAAPETVSAVIPGARKPHHIVENVASHAAKLPADLWAELKSEKLISASAPVPS